MERNIRIAAIAVSSLDGLVTANYERALRLTEISLAARPDVVVLPEAFAAGYCADDLTPYAENLDSPFLQRFRELSAAGKCLLVVGYLEKAAGGIRNAAAVFECGSLAGVHYKSCLWPDSERPYRDEVSLMLPGDGIEIFDLRPAKTAVMLCYENTFEKNWRRLAGEADLVLSPFNCEGDPQQWIIDGARIAGVPVGWADRTGTVWAGDGYAPNMGTAGIVAASGEIVAASAPGVEAIVVGEVAVSAG